MNLIDWNTTAQKRRFEVSVVSFDVSFEVNRTADDFIASLAAEIPVFVSGVEVRQPDTCDRARGGLSDSAEVRTVV